MFTSGSIIYFLSTAVPFESPAQHGTWTGTLQPHEETSKVDPLELKRVISARFYSTPVVRAVDLFTVFMVTRGGGGAITGRSLISSKCSKANLYLQSLGSELFGVWVACSLS